MYTEKESLRVMIVTATYRIEGSLHILSGSRLTDALNSKAKDFLAVTDAKIFEIDSGEMKFETSYIAVNRDTIACLFPLEEE
jgi:Na+-transporting NADH:ubiquinone oxidoreductase subunit NqrA